MPPASPIPTTSATPSSSCRASPTIYHHPVRIIGQDDNYGLRVPLCTAPIIAEDGEVLTLQSITPTTTAPGSHLPQQG